MLRGVSSEESERLLDAVRQVTKPYFGRVESSVIFEGEPMTIYPMGILLNTPEPMRTLCRVYEDIIARGAFAVDPEVIQSKEGHHGHDV